MTLRINNNIAALRSVRHMEDSERKLSESLEKISSGFKINRGSDNPAGLVASEQIRGQIVGLNQAIANSELATTMVQTTEAALNEVNNLLIRTRQLALQASNEGSSDATTLEANQLEIEDALSTINSISKNTQFGKNKLLDGSGGVTGEALGGGLTFISGTVDTRTSPVEGYVVDLSQVATRSFLEGSTSLDEDNISGMQLTLFEGGKTVQVVGRLSDSPESFFGRLRRVAENSGLALDLRLNSNRTLSVRQQNYGSRFTFQGASSTAGVLSSNAGVLQAANPGTDVAGTINEEAAVGQGQLLMGLPGNANTDGLVVRYAGPLEEVEAGGRTVLVRRPQTGIVGVVNMSNNSLNFQVGPNPGQSVTVALPQVNASFLGRSVENDSNFRSLADINVVTTQGSKDAIRMIDAAITELTLNRGKLGAFQRNSLESNIATLRVTAENLMAAESTIRDTDLARELAEFTRHKLQFEAGAAAVAQANQIPSKVITLIS